MVLNHGSRTLGEKLCPENVQGHRVSAACFSQEKDVQDVNITQLVLSIFLTSWPDCWDETDAKFVPE